MIPLPFPKLLDNSLEVKQRERDGVVILDLEGPLVIGDEDLALRQRLVSLLEAGRRNLILNLKDVTEIDATGLGALEFCAEKFREAGGKCVLLNLDPARTELSEVFKLATAFETYQDELDAVNSFFPDRTVPHYDILEFVTSLDHDRHSTTEP
ncbi:MAG TPA: STAS domain-containing protein [Bryobacteraceae bacterium]